MDEKSHFKTKNVLPTSNANDDKQKFDGIIGSLINDDKINEATKYYIQSIIGKDNEYKLDLGDSFKPKKKN